MVKKNLSVYAKNLGLIDYELAYTLQKKLLKQIVTIKINNRKKLEKEQILTPNYLLFCEHPHVYTLGTQGKKANLLISQQELKTNQASFYHINRGGDITYHGPGQLVIYPILDLANFFNDLHLYLRLLEEVIILTLKYFNIDSHREKGKTGVWVYERGISKKICAIGIHSSYWVTMHGMALNINTDLSYFKAIIPCGLFHHEVTSMEKILEKRKDFESIIKIITQYTARLFNMYIPELS